MFWKLCLFIYLLFIYTKHVFQEGDKFSSTASLPYITDILKHENKRTVICTYIQACMALLKKDNNVVSDKLKVSNSLTSSDTFVVYIVHPMCSDGYLKLVCS